MSPNNSSVSPIVRTSTSPEYTSSLAAGVAALLHSGDIVRLEGDLGAGKTTFVRGLAHALGVAPGLVSSPTFVLVNEYPLASERRGIRRLIHVDAYRLQSAEDLDSAGWDRYVTPAGTVQPGCAVVIEWPARIADTLAQNASALTIRFTNLGDSSRQIEVDLPDSWSQRPGVTELREREPIRCPITGVWVEPTRSTYPFAGEKEKLADLNRWFTGAYSIGRRATDADFEDQPAEPERPSDN
ncbi:MAG: tRNA (adenosine(37)-N6)-threonylcarbamoyltransferase complex ATPase subunit type 1 TsaE [Phycisphaerales bacterium]